MADDRLPWRRSVSIDATRSDRVTPRLTAMSLSPFQKASSRLTLVLWPAITIERLTTGDPIDPSVFRAQSELGQGIDWAGDYAPRPVPCKLGLPPSHGSEVRLMGGFG